MRKPLMMCILLLIVLTCVGHFAQAAEWHFPIGYTYENGFGDVVDLFKENVNNSGYSVSDVSCTHIGLSASPYYQFDNGFGLGGSIGPAAIISADPFFFLDFPVGLDGRYTFNLSGTESPYIRLGERHHYARYDFVQGTTSGIFAALGLEFLKSKERSIHGGVEVAYDGATIEMKKKSSNGTETLKPGGVLVSLFVVF